MTLSIAWESGGTLGVDGSGDLTESIAIHVLEFDCVTSESHEGLSVVTEHAVETGAPLADHKRAMPRRVTIEAIVTNTPLDAPPLSGSGASNNVRAEIGEGNVVRFSQPFDRIADVISALDSLRIDAVSCTLTTRHRTYDDIQIMRVTEPREADDGDTLRFTIEVQEIRIAETRTVDSPTPREARGQSETDRGGQESEDTATSRSSALARARDEYAARRAAGASRTDAALSAAGAAFGG